MANHSNTLPSVPSRRSDTGTARTTERVANTVTGPEDSSFSPGQQQHGQGSNSAMHSQLSDTQALLNSMKAKAFQRSLQSRSKPSAPVSKAGMLNRRGTAYNTSASTPNMSLAVKEQSNSLRQHRIASHVAALEDATASIKLAFGSNSRHGEPCMKTVCRNLAVGRATTTSSSPLSVYGDRLEYKFHHQQHGSVHMLMWFRDIQEASIDMTTLTLSFHVNRPLRHFGSDYDGSSKLDRLSMQFCSQGDADEFCRQCTILKLGSS